MTDTHKVCRKCGQINTQPRWRCHLCEETQFIRIEEYMNIKTGAKR